MRRSSTGAPFSTATRGMWRRPALAAWSRSSYLRHSCWLAWARAVPGGDGRPARSTPPGCAAAAPGGTAVGATRSLPLAGLVAEGGRTLPDLHPVGPDSPPPGRPRSTISDRRRQTLKPQPAGQRRFGRQRPSSRSASITSTTSVQRHHGHMRWRRRPRRVALPARLGRWSAPVPEPWRGRRILFEPGFAVSPGGWTPPPGVLPAWNWLPPEGASPRLDLVPLWVRAWYQLPLIDRYAHAWMWRHGAWKVRPPDMELGHRAGTD
jgi:hypothetical protein